jgi:hypothetical protein
MTDEQQRPRAIVRVTRRRIEVTCRYTGTQLPLESGKRALRDQIGSAVLAHEHQCGRCDTTAAPVRGSRGFRKNLDAVPCTRGQIDEQRAAQERGRLP